jgi:hypothetical protein
LSYNRILKFILLNKVKVKLSMYRPWRPLELREVEAPTFSDIRVTDGGKVVSPTSRRLFTPRKIPDTHFYKRMIDLSAIVRLEGLGRLKKILLFRDLNRRPSGL